MMPPGIYVKAGRGLRYNHGIRHGIVLDTGEILKVLKRGNLIVVPSFFDEFRFQNQLDLGSIVRQTE